LEWSIENGRRHGDLTASRSRLVEKGQIKETAGVEAVWSVVADLSKTPGMHIKSFINIYHIHLPFPLLDGMSLFRLQEVNRHFQTPAWSAPYRPHGIYWHHNVPYIFIVGRLCDACVGCLSVRASL
jgi:hypothetical protein